MSQAGLAQDAQSSSATHVAGSMSQTPTHDHHNAGLLALIPPASPRLVEIGCSSGAMQWRQCSGGDAVAAVNDAQAFQYLLRAVPE